MQLNVKLSELMLTWLDANDIEFDGTIDNDYEITLEFKLDELRGTYKNLMDFIEYYSNEEGDN